MRSHQTYQILKDASMLDEVGCNKCGKRTKLTGDEYEKHLHVAEKYSEFHLFFGYGNRYDGQRWQFDLCEDCLTELIKSFKVVPTGFGEDGYYAKYPQTMFEHWKETGEVDLEAGMTPEEIEAQGGSIYMEAEYCEACNDPLLDEDDVYEGICNACGDENKTI